jgi:hypothetical protein
MHTYWKNLYLAYVNDQIQHVRATYLVHASSFKEACKLVADKIGCPSVTKGGERLTTMVMLIKIKPDGGEQPCVQEVSGSPRTYFLPASHMKDGEGRVTPE